MTYKEFEDGYQKIRLLKSDKDILNGIVSMFCEDF